MTLGVKVESWGEYCGPRPISYTSKQVRPVNIRSRDKHLIFSSGGLRTDRCGSPNPKLRKISMQASPGSWKMVCETERSDPKYERGVYTLVAKGDNKLEYKAESKYNWALKGDNCVAISIERRVFARADEKSDQGMTSGGQEASTSEVKKPESLVEQVPVPRETSKTTTRRKLDDNEPWCDSPGPAKKITIQPQRHRLGPGESVCFKAVAVDEEGCRTPVKASWTAMQNERVVRGPLQPNGCFSAGETAADAEGIYIVTAQVGQKSATAEVSVVFPDLGELLAARLRPLQDVEDMSANAPIADAKDPPHPGGEPDLGPTPSARGAIAVGNSGENDQDSLKIVWLVVGLLGVAFVGFIAVIVLGMKRRGARSGSNEGWEAAGDREEEDTPAPSSGANSGMGREKLRCPECKSEFDAGARFCPHDGSTLEIYSKQKNRELIITGSRVSAGMVCPKCHRGYEMDARFCPHDSSRLVPYESWRKNRTGRQQKN